ncbi:DUF917 domain-containing protein [Nonomuraea sp. NPDC050663]|uniref:DUF917 domain-containing protein n=1 Tax=Nonomuraea sp. NPDC050663 TaxID=3364370 RepID=UPI0037A022DF
MLITRDHVDALAAGATLLGSGGGGDTTVVTSMLRHVLTHRGPVPLITADQLPEDALIVPVAATGSITVMLERLPSGHEFVQAVNAVGTHLQRRPEAVIGFEAGGANLLFAVAAAAWTGLPLVDGDGMGRAFPGIDQVTFNAGIKVGVPTVSATPAALADPSGNHVLLAGSASNADAERLLRSALTSLGGWAATAIYPMTSQQVRDHAILGSISSALDLGSAFLHARRAEPGNSHAMRARAAAIADHGADRVFLGTVESISRHARPRTGATVVIHHQRDLHRSLRIEVADEYLLAIDDGEIVIQVPDIIAVLDSRTWHPIAADQLATGHHVEVLRLPAPAAWTAPHALPLVAPRAFGLRVLDSTTDQAGRFASGPAMLGGLS